MRYAGSEPLRRTSVVPSFGFGGLLTLCFRPVICRVAEPKEASTLAFDAEGGLVVGNGFEYGRPRRARKSTGRRYPNEHKVMPDRIHSLLCVELSDNSDTDLTPNLMSNFKLFSACSRSWSTLAVCSLCLDLLKLWPKPRLEGAVKSRGQTGQSYAPSPGSARRRHVSGTSLASTKPTSFIGRAHPPDQRPVIGSLEGCPAGGQCSSSTIRSEPFTVTSFCDGTWYL